MPTALVLVRDDKMDGFTYNTFHMIRAKKSLGQNFLHSKGALAAIARAGNLSSKDTVLEIGPGEGALTRFLFETGAQVVAVEKDDRLIPLLSETFETEVKNKQFTLVHDDILLFDCKKNGLKPFKYKLVANIPYYLTGLIFRNFIAGDCPPSQAVFLVQHEVAKRVVARDGKESLLSLSIKAFGEPKLVQKVPRTAFHPAPNVDSAILYIGNIHDGGFKKGEREQFFNVLHAGFAHKRKKLVGNLSEVFDRTKVERVFSDLKLSPNVRAEDVKLSEWKSLAKLLG